MYLKNKSAIVTGAGRGIGREIALFLAKEGASVFVNDPGVGRGGERTNDGPADEVVAEIKSFGGEAIAGYESVADFAKAGEMVENCVRAFGKIDILVNSAGVLRERMVWNMSEDDFDTVIAVHLKGHWAMSHHAIKRMRAAGHGRIINFSSDAFKGSVGQCNYSAAKAGIIGLTRAIAKEVAKYGITCNAICPMADTRMMVNDAVIENRKRRLAAGLITQEEFDRASRPRGPEHIAPLVAYLATDQADFINGQLFHVERGLLSTYYLGEVRRSLTKETDEIFSIGELADKIPAVLLNGVDPVVPPVRMHEAQRAESSPKA